MEIKTDYQIVKLSQLNCAQTEQAIDLFVDGFYNIFSMSVSKDKDLLKELFIDAFDRDMVFVCLSKESVIGFLGLGNINKRCVCLSRETCKRLLGKFKGALIYAQMGRMLHEITVHAPDEGYIDYITTDSHYRGKGIATKLIKYICDTLPYKQYMLDVLSKNTNAKNLYEYLGFTQVRIKKNPLVMLSGMGRQIIMKLDVNSKSRPD